MRYAATVLTTMLAGCATAPGSFSELLTPDVGSSPPAAMVEEPPNEDGFAFDGYLEDQTAADGVDPVVDDPSALVEELGAVGLEVPLDGGALDNPPDDGGLDAPQFDEPLVGEPLIGEPLDGEPLDGEPLAISYDEQPIGQIDLPPPPMPAQQRWGPEQAVSLSWGVRLVTTMDETTPPRAVLGLPNGSEVVVKAGDLLPNEGVIVLAIGSGIVQLGKVTPQGDHASVESLFLQSMFDSRSRGQ